MCVQTSFIDSTGSYPGFKSSVISEIITTGIISSFGPFSCLFSASLCLNECLKPGHKPWYVWLKVVKNYWHTSSDTSHLKTMAIWVQPQLSRPARPPSDTFFSREEATQQRWYRFPFGIKLMSFARKNSLPLQCHHHHIFAPFDLPDI